MGRGRLLSGTLVTFLFFCLAGCADSSPQTDGNQEPGETRGKTVPLTASSGGDADPSSGVAKASASELSLTNLATESLMRNLQEQASKINPHVDQWDIEVFGELVEPQFKRLTKAIEHADESHLQEAGGVAAIHYAGGGLRPDPLEVVWERDGVQLWAAKPAKASEAVEPFGDRDGFQRALASLAAPLQGAREAYAKFKLIDVEIGSNETLTTSYFEAGAVFDDRAVQQRSTWRCRWSQAAQDSAPELLSVQVEDYRELTTQQAGGTWFADCTLDALQHAPEALEQLRRGMNQWAREIPTQLYISLDTKIGLAIGDANGDGLDDVYLCQASGLPNRFLVRDENGLLRDRSAESGVDLLDHTTSALFIDLDNDGDQDLAMTVYHHVLLFENDSTGRFRRRAELELADFDVQSVSAADFDQDGKLDLYAGAYRATNPQGKYSFHDARNGGRNALFRNEIEVDGEWNFTDVSAQVGLIDVDHTQRFTFGSVWEDYDNDGDQDLYVINDFGPKALYRNDGGTFVNVTRESGADDLASGMSASWADFNHDGWMDLYNGNMFSSAGTRITKDGGHASVVPQHLRGVYQRFAKGNTLYANSGDGSFREVGAEAGVEMGRWSWSSLFVDLNNDSWEDLVVANGMITNDDSQDL